MFSDEWHSVKKNRDFTFFFPPPQRDGVDMDKAGERVKIDNARNLAGAHGLVADSGFRMRGGFPLFIGSNGPLANQTVTYYMSSGAYAVGNYNLGDMTLTQPSVLYKSDTVAARESTHLSPHYNRAPPADGDNSNIYTQAVRGPGQLTTDSISMLVTPASCFTGLMRRLVQAKYGSGSSAVFSTVAVDYSYGGSSGVIYDSAGDAYWLVYVTFVDPEDTFQTVFAYPISFEAGVKQLVADTATQPEKDALTCLMFASATVSAATKLTLGTFTPAAGIPLAFGWKFSLTTNLADIVVAENPGYTYDRQTWTHMRLTFSFSVGGTPSFNYQVVEQQDAWMLSARSPLWVPYAGQTVWANKQNTSPDPTIDSNAPVYVVYDGDNLKTVRWTYTQGDTTAFSQTEWNRRTAEAKQAESVYPVGATYAYAKYETGKRYTYGFTDGVVSSVTDIRQTLHEYEGNMTSSWYSWVTAGMGSAVLLGGAEPPTTPPGPYSVNFPNYHAGWDQRARVSGPTDYNVASYVNNGTNYYQLAFSGSTDPTPGNHWSTFYSAFVLRSISSVTRNGMTRSLVTPLVIPANDAAGYYIASRLNDSGPTTTAVSNTYYRGFNKDYLMNTTDPWTINSQWGPSLIAQINQHDYLENKTGDAPGSTSSFNANATRNAINITFQTNGGIVSGFSPASSEIFNPIVATPYLTQMVTAISSSLDPSARFQAGTMTDSTIITTDDYPVTIDTFVGAT